MDIKEHFHPEHWADLQKSGLNEDTIKVAGIYSVPPGDISKILKWNPPQVESAMAFSYPGTNFIRLKVFPSYKDEKGHNVKYLSPKGTPPQIYIPPQASCVIKDPTVPLAITEGEKKALKGCQEGLMCIAIGGLWCWLVDGKSIAGLDEVAWTEREVTLYPDSDVWSRPDLLKAVYALGKGLEGRGAKVKVAIIPGGAEPKVGLDDFLNKNGQEGLKKFKVTDLRHFAREVKEWWQGWIQKRSEGNVSEPMPQISSEERERALTLLKRKDLLSQYLKDIERLGCVGEEENKVTLYLAFTSRYLCNPTNITVKGESAVGKNFLVGSVKRFIPPEAVLFISSATPKAFFYMPDDLCHMVIIIAEAPGGQDADYSIRSFQSEGELVIIVPEKDKTSGRIETKERKVKGPVAFIQTTTKPHLHVENETRNFDLFIDESQEQTKAIFNVQNDKYLAKIDSKEIETILKDWQNAQRLLEPLPVLIPYVECIEFPTKPLRVRRDRTRFLALIEASALLHQYQRERKEVNGQNYTVANLDDYEIAYGLGVKILERVLKGASPRCEELMEKASKFQEDFTRTEIEGELGWARGTVTKYLNEAVNLGCLDKIQQGKGNPALYRFIKPVSQTGCPLLTRLELEERLLKLSKPVEMTIGQVN